jgi:hypothetical protein
MYTFWVVLHIISAGAFIGLGFATVVTNGLRNGAAGTYGEFQYMRTLLVQARVFGNIGAIGVLVTGAAAAGMAHLPWFAFDQLPWLALKQTVWILIAIMTGALFIPRAVRARKMIVSELTMPSVSSGASKELKRMIDQVVVIIYLIELLVLLNVILGESQAMLWVRGQ